MEQHRTYVAAFKILKDDLVGDVTWLSWTDTDPLFEAMIEPATLAAWHQLAPKRLPPGLDEILELIHLCEQGRRYSGADYPYVFHRTSVNPLTADEVKTGINLRPYSERTAFLLKAGRHDLLTLSRAAIWRSGK